MLEGTVSKPMTEDRISECSQLPQLREPGV